MTSSRRQSGSSSMVTVTPTPLRFSHARMKAFFRDRTPDTNPRSRHRSCRPCPVRSQIPLRRSVRTRVETPDCLRAFRDTMWSLSSRARRLGLWVASWQVLHAKRALLPQHRSANSMFKAELLSFYNLCRSSKLQRIYGIVARASISPTRWLITASAPLVSTIARLVNSLNYAERKSEWASMKTSVSVTK